MRRGDQREVTLPDGRRLGATYLGRGRYCTAYRSGDEVYCFVVEDDYSKDIIAEAVEDGLPHVPDVDKLGDVVLRGKFRKVYRMPYYPNISARDKDAWPVLCGIKAEADRAFAENYGWKKPLEVYGYEFARAVIDRTRGRVPETVTSALENLADAMANYGCGWTFEFSRRNIGTDSRGRIVFRDILFDAESMARQWREKRNWHTY